MCDHLAESNHNTEGDTSDGSEAEKQTKWATISHCRFCDAHRGQKQMHREQGGSDSTHSRWQYRGRDLSDKEMVSFPERPKSGDRQVGKRSHTCSDDTTDTWRSTACQWDGLVTLANPRNSLIIEMCRTLSLRGAGASVERERDGATENSASRETHCRFRGASPWRFWSAGVSPATTSTEFFSTSYALLL